MEHVAQDSIRICPRCGSINIKSNPLSWRVKEGDVIVYECLSCKNTSRDFPVIKKNNVKTFRANLKGVGFRGF